jgi:subtilisin family serine protease
MGAPGTNIRSTWPGTETITSTDFSDWTLDSSWAQQNFGFYALTNPTNWDGSSATYSASISDWAYKDFGAIAQNADSAILEYYVNLYINTSDYLYLYWYESGFTLIDSYTSVTTSNTFVPVTYDISSLALGESTCDINFLMETDSSGTGYGAAIAGFSITTMELGTNVYETLEGTSMAAPHAAGLAAMLFAFNPDYTYSDVLESMRNGGEDVSALSGNTTTEKAINAFGSLKYISKPTGVAAVLQ